AAGPFLYYPCHRDEVIVFEQQLTQRISLMRVESRRNKYQIGFEAGVYSFDGRVEYASLLLCRNARPQWNVHRVALAAADSSLAPRAGAWIPRILVHRKEENRWVIVENTLCSVAMMDIPVNDGHPFDLRIMSLRVARGDSDIIKKTEPHRPFRGGVMARRTHW